MVCSIVVMVCKKIVLNEMIKETELEAEKIKWSDTIRKATEQKYENSNA